MKIFISIRERTEFVNRWLGDNAIELTTFEINRLEMGASRNKNV